MGSNVEEWRKNVREGNIGNRRKGEWKTGWREERKDGRQSGKGKENRKWTWAISGKENMEDRVEDGEDTWEVDESG